MIISIIKRDGREVPYDRTNIANAIFKAAKALGGRDYETADRLALKVEDEIIKTLKTEKPTVEQVQDMVEKVLVETGHTRTAKEFILYRASRTRVREMNTKLMKIYEDLTFKPAEDNEIKRENANIDGDTAMGTMLKYGSEGAKQFYEMFILNPEHAKAHTEGDIHIHDLDFLTLTTTCCQIDLKKLFKDGFCTGHGFLREPNDIASYSSLACIAIQSNQNDQHGGQSIPNFDYSMATGVEKTYAKLYYRNIAKSLELLTETENIDEVIEKLKAGAPKKPSLENKEEYLAYEKEFLADYMTEEQTVQTQNFAFKNTLKETDRATFQAMEAFVHNLNTMHSRAGAQIPFSSINYGTDTTPEGRMVTKNILLATEAGLGNGETAIFPINIFKVKEGINYNPEDVNYDLFKLACRVSAKRLFPNFSFIDAPFNKKYYKEGNPETEIAYMGCRTRVIGNAYDPENEIVTGRGNLSFTSINLPRLALLAKGDVDLFYTLLTNNLKLVCEQLYARFKIQASKKVRNYPFLMGQGIWIDSDKLSYDDEVEEILKHGTLTVGFIGLAECLKALIGEHHGESEKAQNMGLGIISHMRKYCDDLAQETKMNYSVIATPAEGLSGRFVKMDAKRFGIIEGVTDRDYYTNSFHVPVYYNIPAFKKISIEAPYHNLTNAGHITYIELDGDPLGNLDAFEKVVRYMKESGIGYGSINHPVDRDPVCGYTGIIGETCPKCGRSEDDGQGNFDRIRRITGYLVGTLDRFNTGKRAEEADRVKHSLKK
ncbi:MAG: anaerobic ribonucleoside triphosphate reductase [Clostridia bacterium]